MAKRKSKRERDKADGFLPVTEMKGGIVPPESATPPSAFIPLGSEQSEKGPLTGESLLEMEGIEVEPDEPIPTPPPAPRKSTGFQRVPREKSNISSA